jgi:hypothetical protein
MVEIGIDPMELLKVSGQNVSALISLNDDKNLEAKFENGIITVT